jgi:hypothetical protein
VLVKNGVSGKQIFEGQSFNKGAYLVKATNEKMMLTSTLMKQ